MYLGIRKLAPYKCYKIRYGYIKLTIKLTLSISLTSYGYATFPFWKYLDQIGRFKGSLVNAEAEDSKKYYMKNRQTYTFNY